MTQHVRMSCCSELSDFTDLAGDDTSLDLDFVVAYMNSEFADWYFRLFSSGSKVNEYQFNALPLPQISAASGLQWREMIKAKEWLRLKAA